MSKPLPRSAKAYLWLVALAAVGVLAYWLRAWRGPLWPNPALMAALGALAILAQHCAFPLGPRRKVDVSIAVYFVGLLLGGALSGVALTGASQLVGQSTLALRRHPVSGKRRRSLRSVLFNTAQFTLAAGLSALVYYSMLPELAPAPVARVENVWALPAAAATMYLVNSLLVAGMIALQRGQGLAEVWLTGRRQTAPQLAGLLLVGVLAARSSMRDPWMVVVLLLLLGIIHLALKRTVQLAEQTARLRASEARYRTLVEMAPDVIYSISAEDGTFTSLSPAFERLSGWAVADWLGKPFADLVHPEDLPLATERFAQALRGKTAPPFQIRARSRSGEYRVADVLSAPKVEDGTVAGVFGIARDVTERQRMEAERSGLSAALARLQERERIAMDLHDGAIQSLYAVALTLAAQERLLDQSKAAAGATRKVLRSARSQIERVVQELRNYIFDLRLRDLEHGSLRAGLEALAEELRINALVRPKLRVDVASDVEQQLAPEAVAHLLQITREATSNVIRHAGATEVTISLDQVDPERVQLTVRDNGRGFDIAEASTMPDGPARGQGLRNMVVRAKRMRAQLAVLSQPGCGTEVRLTTPVADRPLQREQVQERAA